MASAPHDIDWIAAVAGEVNHAKVTTLLLPGIGTVDDLKHAYDAGARSVRIATHCTEADISRQHIETAREIGMDTVGFLMMAHMLAPEKLVEQAKLMESLRRAVRLRHQLGRRAPARRSARSGSSASAMRSKPETEIGIHAHHNLSLGVANSVAARAGAVRVDASLGRHGGGRGQRAARGPDRGAANARGWNTRLRPVQTHGRGRRPRAPAAGQAGAGRPRNRCRWDMPASTRASCATPRPRPKSTASIRVTFSRNSAGAAWSAARRT